MPKIYFKEFSQLNGELFNQIKPLYEATFETVGDPPWNEFSTEFEDYIIEEQENVHLFGAFIGKKLIGFGVNKFLKEFTYVPYFTIDENYRNQGIGTALADKCIELAKQDAQDFKVLDSLLLFEVDIPKLAPTEEERLVRELRVKFFLKKGSIFLDINYIEPKFGDDGPSYLVMQPLSDKNYIESDKLVRYVKIIYKEETNISKKISLKYLNILVSSIGSRDRIYGVPNLQKSI